MPLVRAAAARRTSTGAARLRAPRVVFDGDVLSRTHFGGAVRVLLGLLEHVDMAGRKPELLLRRNPRQPLPTSVKQIRPADVSASDPLDVFVGTDYVAPAVPCRQTVILVHDLIEERLPGLVPASSTVAVPAGTKRELIESADHIVTVSETTAADVVEFYGRDPADVSAIYPGLDTRFMNASGAPEVVEGSGSGLELSEPFILHVGGRHGYKNFTRLLRGFCESSAASRHLLVNVGSELALTPPEEVLVEQWSVRDRLRLLGHVADDKLTALYRGAAAVVVPSLHEGFGLPLLEAMALGAPVACASTPVFAEIGGDVPVTFEPTDPISIAGALDRVLTCPDPGRIAAGRSRASEFTWSRAADRFGKVITHITCRARGLS